MGEATQDASAWSQYWLSTSGAAGCLPGRSSVIDEAHSAKWRTWVAGVDHGSKLLDLACGNGAVIATLLQIRDDIQAIGVDYAPALPPGPRNARLIPNVQMELLPFEDQTFSALTSQFGFEYGNLAKVTAEMARVMLPGSPFGLMIHNEAGPVVEHAQARLASLEWAVSSEGLSGLSRAAGDQTDLSELRRSLAVVTQRAIAKHGDGSAAHEIMYALGRTIVSRNPSVFAAQIGLLSERANDEIRRLKALSRAAHRVADPSELGGPFSSHGLLIGKIEPVTIENHPPIAWFVEGRRI